MSVKVTGDEHSQVRPAVDSLFGMMRESMLRARAEAAKKAGVPPEMLTAIFVESKWEGDEVVIVWDFELKPDEFTEGFHDGDGWG